MDKWFNKPWFIKVISLFMAAMLFLIVNMDNVNNQPVGIPGITTGSKVLEDVDLTVLFDEDSFVVTEAPESVQVTLRGPNNALILLQLRSQHELFVDLRGKEPGVHYERVEHRGFPNELSVAILPVRVRVTIQEKQTVSFPVEVEIMNEGQIEEGYTIGTPTVSPTNVDITAAKGIIEQITSVRASIDVSGRNATFREASGVVVLDQSGNNLNLNTDPPAVEVTIPIISPNKEVPIRVEREGELRQGIAIDSITTEPNVVTIYGPAHVINDISFIDGIKVDLSAITESTTIEVPVPIQEGLERVNPETISIVIEVTEEETREFSEIPIEIIGLDNGYDVTFINPEEGSLDIAVMGSQSALGRLERDDIQVFIDIEGLSPGEHTVPLQYNGPQNVRVDKRRSSVRIEIINGEDMGLESDSTIETEEIEEESDTS